MKCGLELQLFQSKLVIKLSYNITIVSPQGNWKMCFNPTKIPHEGTNLEKWRYALGLNKQFVAELVQKKNKTKKMLLISFQIFPTDTHLEKEMGLWIKMV